MIVIVLDDQRWKANVLNIRSLTRALIKDVLHDHGYLQYNVEVVYSNDALLHQLNYEHRNIDRPTNVLSFCHASVANSMCDDLGEIFLSFDRILQESISKGISLYDHMLHILVHGLLHLIGYTHDRKPMRLIMEQKEIEVLKKMNIKNPYD